MLDATNPLANPSTLPYGLPDFRAIKIEHLKPAILQGMAEQSAQWKQIAENSDEPTKENTIVALDDSGSLYGRALRVFSTLANSIGGDKLSALQEELAPFIAEHSDAFFLNADMYRRLKSLQMTDLDDETAWFIQDTVDAFERSGVNLGDAEQGNLRELNARIALLEAKIDSRISTQLSTLGLKGENIDDLSGLSDSKVKDALEAGKEHDTTWFLALENYTSHEALASLDNPLTRSDLLKVSMSRGLSGDEKTGTADLILELTHDRAKRAGLLGFPNHAEYVMAGETIPGQSVAASLLTEIGAAAQQGVKNLELELAKIANGRQITAADWPFFEAKLRHDSLDLDPVSLKEYFPLSQVISDGVFYAANRLYGITFTRRPELNGWHEDVEIWEVLDTDGSPVGLIATDYYARPGKSGGAWMMTLVPACGRTGERPVVTNDANFTKPIDGSEVLLSWDNVETCFHEFGHALHGLLTNTYYRETEGTSVPSDFVELPSQLNEMWAYHPDVLTNMARHVRTGERLPQDVINRLAKSKSSFQEYATLEFTQSAIIDQKWHLLKPDEEVTDVEAFEQASIERSGITHPSVPPRYRSGYFAHAFAGGYDGAYYSYLWSEAMVAELEEWIRARPNGDLSLESGQILRSELLSRGNSRPPMDSFRAILGRDPSSSAINRRRGL